MGRGLDATIGLLFKWIIVIALFFCAAMPAQIIWFFIFPFAKPWGKKQAEKTGVPLTFNLWTPLEWYGTKAKSFIEYGF